MGEERRQEGFAAAAIAWVVGFRETQKKSGPVPRCGQVKAEVVKGEKIRRRRVRGKARGIR